MATNYTVTTITPYEEQCIKIKERVKQEGLKVTVICASDLSNITDTFDKIVCIDSMENS